MKTWKVLLVLALSFGVIGGWWMMGCGGGSDEGKCKDACNRCGDFFGGYDQCFNDCKEESCASDCLGYQDCGAMYGCVLEKCGD